MLADVEITNFIPLISSIKYKLYRWD